MENVSVAVSGRHCLYQALGQLLFVMVGFNSNAISSAQLAQLILSVHSLKTCNTMFLHKDVQMVVADLLSCTSVLHYVGKFRLVFKLVCYLFAL